ncbi:hypothetical protein [Waltera sp.]|uniref:hypothetical protein n=1 Tax=Waltera sp. TaxID=2815806 RepID=UPI003AB3691B
MNFRESYFHNEFGLSCVEDYIIYILCKDTINWARIFFKSYVDIEEIINYLFLEGQEYSSIKFIERIQNTLIQNGMLNLVPLELKNVENIEKKLVFLMELKDGATRGLLNINTWRNDHFIMVYKDVDDKYSYVNDRPYLTGNLEYKDLLKYAGKEYVLDIRLINNDIAAVVNEESLFQLEQKLNSQSILAHNIWFECEKIRDCIGIYRVVVKRLQAFFGSYNNIYRNKRFAKIYLNRIKKDFHLLEQYLCLKPVKLDIHARIFWSKTDDTILTTISNWDNYFTGAVEYEEFSGGHFYLNSHYRNVLDIILNDCTGVD